MATCCRLDAKGRLFRLYSPSWSAVFSNNVLSTAGSRPRVVSFARVAVEALHADFWYKFVGLDGRVVGMTSFGESAPIDDLMQYFGFTLDNVVATVEDVLL